MGRIAALSTALLSTSASAQGLGWRADVFHTWDFLSGGYGQGSSLSVSLAKTLAPRKTVYGSLLNARRFGLVDQQFTLGAYAPVRPRLGAMFEISASPTFQISPHYAGAAALFWELGKGWVLSPGVGFTRYRSDELRSSTLGLERYVGRYRFAYALQASWAQKAGFGTGNRLSVTDYIGERSSWTFALNYGREVESIGLGNVVRMDVFGVSLGARIAAGRAGAWSAEVGYSKQGRLYIRRSVTFGYRHEF